MSVPPTAQPFVPVVSACLALALFTCAGCVTGKAEQRPAPAQLRMPTTKIFSDAELAKLNDEELFAGGTSAFAAEDYVHAAAYFGRIADVFPNSPHRREALYNAGLAHERLRQWDEASARFSELADAAKGTGDALDATFRLAETYYQLGRFKEASALLKTVGARPDLPFNARLEAQVQQGICEVEDGNLDGAEATLRKALDAYQNSTAKEEVDDYFPAQAQFFIGEIYRLRYESVQLKPDQSSDALSTDLELKAELLLSAQGHYLRSIRMNNGYWATASGAQIGGLYENLYHQMVNAPAPGELKGEEVEVYRDELRKKIRVLLTKAISIYESTLEAAERVGTSGPFIEQTRESLRKMKELLLSDTREDASSPVDTTPSKRRPGTGSLEPHTQRSPAGPRLGAPG